MNNQVSTLPEDFDGIFKFTNYSDEDFIAKWNNIAYTFPKMKTVPMVIPNATPEEVQNIRKKFAKEFAIREFTKTPKFVGMNNVQPGGTPALYTDSDLAPFIQKCLEPLPLDKISAVKLPKTFDENKLSRDEEGNPVTTILDKKASLKRGGSEIVDL